jgi:hypothetical protein
MEPDKPLTPNRIMGMSSAFEVSGVLKGAIELARIFHKRVGIFEKAPFL